MTTVITTDPLVQSALTSCVSALRRVAGYELDPSLDRRMQEMGERKELLTPEEHDELMALVGFAQQRTIEKSEASLALRRLQEAFPELVNTP